LKRTLFVLPKQHDRFIMCERERENLSKNVKLVLYPCPLLQMPMYHRPNHRTHLFREEACCRRECKYECEHQQVMGVYAWKNKNEWMNEWNNEYSTNRTTLMSNEIILPPSTTNRPFSRLSWTILLYSSSSTSS
jgi:hypothetical protein